MGQTATTFAQAYSILSTATLTAAQVAQAIFLDSKGNQINGFTAGVTGTIDLNAYAGNEADFNDFSTATFIVPGSANDPHAAADNAASLAAKGYLIVDFSGSNPNQGFDGTSTLFKVQGANTTLPSGPSLPSGGDPTYPVSSLIAIQTEAYNYDPNGKLVLQPQTEGTVFVDIGASDLAQLDNDNAPGDTLVFSGYADAPCFAEGTSLSTPSGSVTVESLRVGDMVSAVEDGSVVSRSVVWVGKRTIGLSQHPVPATVRPVCIRRDAFRAGVPSRDLVVSPDHAIAVDGALIPARLLVNGATVVIDAARASVTYYHVELERHSVVLAEGLATESYLDTGNRSMFENGPAVSLRPDFSVSARVASGESATCLPLLVDEASVRPVWTMLAERAAGRGHAVPGIATTREAELRVLADGAALPVSFDGAVLRCVVPAGAGAVMVASRSARPADVKPWLDDRRKLGVAVASVSVDGAEMALDDAALAGGWWGVESDGAASWRWTDGAARLALGVSDTARTLVITLRATGEYVDQPSVRLAA